MKIVIGWVVAVLWLGACLGGSDDAGAEADDTAAVAAALLESVDFAGGTVITGALPATTANSAVIEPLAENVIMSPGADSIMALEVVNPDEADDPVTATLVFFARGRSHVEVAARVKSPVGAQVRGDGDGDAADPVDPVEASTRSRIDNAFSVGDDVCDALCDKIFAIEVTEVATLAGGGVGGQSTRTLVLDCRTAGDAAACGANAADDVAASVVDNATAAGDGDGDGDTGSQTLTDAGNGIPDTGPVGTQDGGTALAPGSTVAFAASLGGGGSHTCGVRADNGEVECWGVDDGSQLDLGQVTGAPVGIQLSSVSSDASHNCGIRADNAELECWGRDDSGQVTGAPAAVAFTAVEPGTFHTCGIRADNGQMECWGSDSDGQVSGFTPGGAYSAVAGGFVHTCGIVQGTGSIECWGVSDAGVNDLGQVTSAPVGGGGYIAIAAGNYHSCAVRGVDGEVECWGASDGSANDYGQVLDAPSGVSFVDIDAGDFHTCGLRDDSTILCWGRDDFGQVSGGPVRETYSAITTGGFHTCGVRVSDAIVECWGNDANGQVSAVP